MKKINLKDTRNLKKPCLVIAACLITIALAFCMCACNQTSKNSGSSSKSNSPTQKSTTQYSADSFKATCYADIVVENYGTITVGLDANAAPITVENFKKLANSGFYNGLTFHRIMKGFMAQGGDPKGDGTGGSNEKIKGEFTENGVNNTLAHVRGAMSMARSTDPDSASSQFFIVDKTSENNSAALDGKYACFGYVQSGMEVVDKICDNAKPTDNNGTISKDQQPVIKSITIREA